MHMLDLTGDITLTDGTFRITGSTGNFYRLQNLATGEHTSEHLADILSRLTEMPARNEVSPQKINNLTAPDRREVESWANHIEELISGTRPGHDNPRPQYDPTLTSLNQRIDSKVAELHAHSLPASRATLLRKKALYEVGGAAALIDGRKNKNIGKFDRADSRVIDAMTSVIAKHSNKSTMTQSWLQEMMAKELLVRYHGDAPAIPSEATLYRHFQLLTNGKYTTGKATTRRSAANTPNRTYRTAHRLLPGEEVQVDSTPMDLLVRVKGRDEPVRPILTVMIDRATRSIIASTIRLEGAKGYDHALLLAQALVPFQNRPDRSAHRALVANRRPEFPLLSTAARLDLERARPLIFPRRIMTDNGKDYLSTVFTSACRKYGIDITMSAIHTPTDKGMVERNFQSINTLFTQRLPGYVGNHNVNRGYKVEEQNLLDVATLAELFDDWVVNVWQNRPHHGLRDPFEPSIVYSPNQAYKAAAAFVGFVASPMTRDDFIDMLPTANRVIGTTGVQIGNRHYDSDELHPHRGTPSRRPRHDNKWEVKINPYDAMHVWVRSPENTWIECRWRHIESVSQPHFGDISRSLRVQGRNDVAHENAHLAGTTMPSGTPAPEPEAAISTDDLNQDFTVFEPFEFDQE